MKRVRVIVTCSLETHGVYLSREQGKFPPVPPPPGARVRPYHRVLGSWVINIRESIGEERQGRAGQRNVEKMLSLS